MHVSCGDCGIISGKPRKPGKQCNELCGKNGAADRAKDRADQGKAGETRRSRRRRLRPRSAARVVQGRSASARRDRAVVWPALVGGELPLAHGEPPMLHRPRRRHRREVDVHAIAHAPRLPAFAIQLRVRLLSPRAGAEEIRHHDRNRQGCPLRARLPDWARARLGWTVGEGQVGASWIFSRNERKERKGRDFLCHRTSRCGGAGDNGRDGVDAPTRRSCGRPRDDRGRPGATSKSCGDGARLLQGRGGEARDVPRSRAVDRSLQHGLAPERADSSTSS